MIVKNDYNVEDDIKNDNVKNDNVKNDNVKNDIHTYNLTDPKIVKNTRLQQLKYENGNSTTPKSCGISSSDISSVISSNSNYDPEKNYICKKCGTEFKNKQTLKLHEKTSIKCLNDDDNKSKQTKNCEYCDKTFSSKQMKNYHQNTCIEKIKSEITTYYQSEMDKLKEYYEERISKLEIKINSI
jgi:DNA-directed RNA polymerase subunit RPC12/RpoP